jgi:hypothetical protein
MTVPVVHAARPASEMEWEDLLVRYEIAPRALRIALSDGEPRVDGRVLVGDLLRAAVFKETWTAALFAAMREGRPVSIAPRVEILRDDVDELLSRFAGLRARNFAEVQRRGIDVWGWETEAPGEGTVTAHQLIQSAVALDAETLAGVRRALGEAAAC